MSDKLFVHIENNPLKPVDLEEIIERCQLVEEAIQEKGFQLTVLKPEYIPFVVTHSGTGAPEHFERLEQKKPSPPANLPV